MSSSSSCVPPPVYITCPVRVAHPSKWTAWLIFNCSVPLEPVQVQLYDRNSGTQWARIPQELHKTRLRNKIVIFSVQVRQFQWLLKSLSKICFSCKWYSITRHLMRPTLARRKWRDENKSIIIGRQSLLGWTQNIFAHILTWKSQPAELPQFGYHTKTRSSSCTSSPVPIFSTILRCH